MKPKGKLFALLAIFAAIGLITATGAFTTVTATRTANVTATGDASALLAIEPADTNNGGEYAKIDGGTLQLDLSGSGQGVNLNATTKVDYVFNITNQGSQTVSVYITKTGANAQLVTFYNGSVGSSNITTSGNADTLDPGSQMSVSIKIDTTTVVLNKGEQILSDITIHAEAA